MAQGPGKGSRQEDVDRFKQYNYMAVCYRFLYLMIRCRELGAQERSAHEKGKSDVG